jgi:hypothetical protein
MNLDILVYRSTMTSIASNTYSSRLDRGSPIIKSIVNSYYRLEKKGNASITLYGRCLFVFTL